MTEAEIADQFEIERLLARYARAVDTKDWDLYRSLFTADAHLDYSSAPLGRSGSRDEITDWLSQNLAFLPMTMHYITNIEVTNVDARADGDIATVRAQFYNPMQFPGFDELSHCGGYYRHELIRLHDGWRSRALVEENVWFVNPPVPMGTGESRST